MKRVVSSTGFRAAFFDFATCTIHLASVADAPVLAAKPTVVPGFERNGFFFTPSAAARASHDWDVPALGWRRA